MSQDKKNWFGLNFDDKNVESNSVKRKPVKKTVNVHNIENTQGKIENFQFLKKLIPKKVEDLDIHNKKLTELQNWLEYAITTKNTQSFRPILLLTGPTGCGKTTALNVLCRSLNIDIQEWINPVDKDFEYSGGQTHVTRFLEFVSETKYPSLFSQSSNHRLCMIKDIPNILLKKPEMFIDILDECVASGRTGIVFIATETGNNSINLNKHLFTEEILLKYNINKIQFNPCATTLMKNVLKRAEAVVKLNLELLKLPSSYVVDAIIETSSGDICCALNQYYFASLKGASDIPIEITEVAGKKRKRNTKKSRLECMSKDESLGLFHSLGRVLNPKFDESSAILKITYNIDQLVDEFSSQPSTFHSFLHENYMKYYGNFDELVSAALLLSDTEILMTNWIDHQDTLLLALWISVLGVMAYNRNKVSKWTQIRAPKRYTKPIKNDTIENYDVVDSFYCHKIKQSETSYTFNYRTLNNY